ncbi:hypothetical protein PVAG01_01071 [Phlyctema vagabunda]|uniref:Uncharacterized protein n=1 Tax=Phlyctema vagabunda TaxID=108571 RepID=A0ABR4PW22_9HELO
MEPTAKGRSETQTPRSGHEGHHHRGTRLRHFLMPDGKKIHIAPSPEEAATLRQRIDAISIDEPFDLVVNGSPEHLDALRIAHFHHEKKRETLRQVHGETFDEFEHVRSQLDMLGNELHMASKPYKRGMWTRITNLKILEYPRGPCLINL